MIKTEPFQPLRFECMYPEYGIAKSSVDSDTSSNSPHNPGSLYTLLHALPLPKRANFEAFSQNTGSDSSHRPSSATKHEAKAPNPAAELAIPAPCGKLFSE